MSDNYDPVTEAGMESFPASDPPSFAATSGTGSRNPHAFGGSSTSGLGSVFREVDPSSLPHIGQVHFALLEAQEFLGSAMRLWAEDRAEADGHEVVGRLVSLRVDLNDHRLHMEAEGSLFDSVSFEGPWLLSELGHLFDHHDRLDAAIARASAVYEGEQEPEIASAGVFRSLRSIVASLATLLSVEHSLLMAQFCEPPAHD